MIKGLIMKRNGKIEVLRDWNLENHLIIDKKFNTIYQ